MMTINERIFTLLQKKGTSQRDLADYLHIKQTSVSSWKKRCTDPPAKYIAGIAQYFQVSCQFLLTGEESKKREDGVEEFPLDMVDIQLQPDEMTLISIYRELKPNVRTALLKTVVADIWADVNNRLPKGKSSSCTITQNEMIS